MYDLIDLNNTKENESRDFNNQSRSEDNNFNVEFNEEQCEEEERIICKTHHLDEISNKRFKKSKKKQNEDSVNSSVILSF